MIYITGDTHRKFERIEELCSFVDTTKENDMIIILGDNGINFLGPHKDKIIKKKLQRLPITIACVRGNHDQRPSKKIYHEEWCYGGEYEHRWAGRFLVEDDFPSLLFMQDGGYYHLGDYQALAIGGAYSIDKWKRLREQYEGFKNQRWFPDEQLTVAEREKILSELKSVRQSGTDVNLVLSHTCPLRYMPYEALDYTVSRSTIDNSMEKWMDEVYDLLPSHCKWMCGHFHINKVIDNMRFIFEGIIALR